MTLTTELIGWAVTVIAVTGVLLNNHRMKSCFLLWMVSNAATFCLHVNAGLIGLAVRDACFFALAIHGYRAWGRKAAG